jgi:hypothetical protein
MHMEALLKYVRRYGNFVYCKLMSRLPKNILKSLLNQSLFQAKETEKARSGTKNLI